MIAGKHILLIVTGGIAAYKALELVRLIQKAGGTVQAVLTRAATEFITPLSVSALSGREALTELFDLTMESRIGHIELSRSADLIVIAPASADLLAKIAHGRADDLASTLVLATDTDILAAPAMNVRMWTAAATRRNIATLEGDGVRLIGPDEGEMACGEYGPGRMAEPAAVLSAIEAYFAAAAGGRPLEGLHVLVTSGPTREAIDPVRYLSNASSGKQGTAIAEALLALGARVTFVTGPAEAPRPAGAEVVEVTTALEMRDAAHAALPADAAIFCAAVADWRPETAAEGKLKKRDGETAPVLRTVPNPDILAGIAALPPGERPALVIGFAAETADLLENARAKRAAKACDWVLANLVGGDTGTFGGARNRVVAVTAAGEDDWGDLSKAEVGHKLAREIADFLAP